MVTRVWRSRYGPVMAAPDFHLVADVDLEAAGSSHPPPLAVERRFGISRSTAGRWDAKARTAGFLSRSRRDRGR